jgi:hypothetical protein
MHANVDVCVCVCVCVCVGPEEGGSLRCTKFQSDAKNVLCVWTNNKDTCMYVRMCM